jgi:hypothetical protein
MHVEYTVKIRYLCTVSCTVWKPANRLRLGLGLGRRDGGTDGGSATGYTRKEAGYADDAASRAEAVRPWH